MEERKNTKNKRTNSNYKPKNTKESPNEKVTGKPKKQNGAQNRPQRQNGTPTKSQGQGTPNKPKWQNDKPNARNGNGSPHTHNGTGTPRGNVNGEPNSRTHGGKPINMVKITVDKNQEKTLTIEKMGNDLEGVCYANGKRCLVQGALVGEKVLVDNPESSGNVIIYNLKKVLVPSVYRQDDRCAYQNECGGCPLMFVEYNHQLKLKTDMIKRRFNLYRDLVEDIEPTNGARNKIQLAFRGEGENIEMGFFNSQTHKVVDVPNCIMHDEKAFFAIRKAIKEWCARYKIIAYNPHRLRGNLRFAVIRQLGDSLLISLVFKSENINGLDYLYSLLKQTFSFVSLYINVNSQISNAVFDGTPEYFLGERKIASCICGIDFVYGAGDFLQTNSEICQKIYSEVMKILLENGVEHVIDAYSGIGITSTLFAKNGIRVSSVEISKSAVETAGNTAKLNGVFDKIHFYAGDFKEIIDSIKASDKTAIFVDPPRAGLGEEVCKSILSKNPELIVYLSCEPDTLVKDVSILSDNYQITKIKPYDMFANTNHVETLVVLARK